MTAVLNTCRTISLTHSRPSIRILSALNDLHGQLRDLLEGDVASYIPELSGVDPNLFGISVVTCEGEVFSVGNAEHEFTLQSLSNPLMYGLALDQLGRERVEKAVGVEPTGNPFHAVVLESGTNRPMNPLVNAGAIAITSLLSGSDPTDRLNRALDAIALYIGDKPAVDMGVFISERTTADRNRAIAYLMRNFGRLDGNLDETLDLYFQMCSVRVNTMQATALVHEAYVKLAGPRDVPWQNRAHFYAAAAEAMRRIVVDYARARTAGIRGGPDARRAAIGLDGLPDLSSPEQSSGFLILNEAIASFERVDPQAALVVRLRYFAGLSVEQTAAALGVSEPTVKRAWAFARGWLREAIETGRV